MQQQTHIRAIYTPDKNDEDKGVQPDPDNAISVTIVTFLEGAAPAVFVDENGLLYRGFLRQFSNCVFVTI